MKPWGESVWLDGTRRWLTAASLCNTAPNDPSNNSHGDPAFQAVIDVLEQGIGLYKGRLRQAKFEIFNPIVWAALKKTVAGAELRWPFCEGLQFPPRFPQGNHRPTGRARFTELVYSSPARAGVSIWPRKHPSGQL